jgi:hypothetical protein
MPSLNIVDLGFGASEKKNDEDLYEGFAELAGAADRIAT